MRSTIATVLLAWLTSGVVPASAGTPDAALRQLFEDERAFVWREDPLAATADGVHHHDDRLPSVDADAQRRRLQADAGFLERLHAIDRTGLPAQQQVSAELFDFLVSQRLALAAHREWRAPLNSDSGFHADVLFMHELADPRTRADYENYIARLRDLPRYFDENIANMRVGMREGFTLPAVILEGLSGVIAAEQFARVEDCPLYRPFATFPDTVPQADRAGLAARGRAAIEEGVIPAYARFQHFFEREYRPSARQTIAAHDLPGGPAYYADLVRYYTTLPDATPDGVHQTGLAEVRRIRGEMEAIVREVGFQGSFAEFLAFLRSDPQFYATTPEQLLREAAWLSKQVDGRLPAFFGRLPRTPYGVRAVPDEIAPNYTGGRYNPGAFGGAGEYWVNTYALNTRPLYVLPALTLHEAVPGHHLQGALAREMVDVPAFRRNFYPHAFGEGWGLYAEKLGEEIGLYRTPYQRFGRLTYEMWRACRLVVDTGMHAKGWSRQQALDYLASNTALSTHEIRTEVDRYIGWPGQALAYKVGELKIIELRRRAEARLGSDFDIRAFHDTVLANGGVTLPVLERQVQAYLDAASDSAPDAAR
ncbi:DUF885 domain-containing protein [Montanilutibacter psychrotolerans]|uniref:DUF885 domain-containing protein n=1 Tax=Montanilutibacter psychrotolerans TaxID=1327343 RepID=UPI002958C13D|nr:DUF885 domain-containing protein [Lysobacter psychrotolerans]